jgi:hypothetical protein
VVLDRKTCLTWERRDPERDVSGCAIQARTHPSKLCWDQAMAYCRALRLDGRTDWRLPTETELSSLVIPANNPALDNLVFPEAVLSFYWTDHLQGAKVTCVDFSNRGTVTNIADPAGPQAFRCVRGP